MFKFDKYPISQKVVLDDGNSLVLFSSYPTEDTIFEEIYGREIFLLDAEFKLIWNINPEKGSINRQTWLFDRGLDIRSSFMFIQKSDDMYKPAHSGRADDKYQAIRSGGEALNIDMKTGHAKFDHWGKY